MEIFVRGKRLADQAGAAHDAAGIDNEAAVGLVGKEGLANAKHEQRIKAAADDGESQRGHAARRSSESIAFISQTRFSAVMMRSMSLMPMNGMMTPPRP